MIKKRNKYEECNIEKNLEYNISDCSSDENQSAESGEKSFVFSQLKSRKAKKRAKDLLGNKRPLKVYFNHKSEFLLPFEDNDEDQRKSKIQHASLTSDIMLSQDNCDKILIDSVLSSDGTPASKADETTQSSSIPIARTTSNEGSKEEFKSEIIWSSDSNNSSNKTLIQISENSQIIESISSSEGTLASKADETTKFLSIPFGKTSANTGGANEEFKSEVTLSSHSNNLCNKTLIQTSGDSQIIESCNGTPTVITDELDLFISEIQQDLLKSGEKSRNVKVHGKRGGYLEQFLKAIESSKTDQKFLLHDKKLGLLCGSSGTITDIEVSFGVRAATIELDNSTKIRALFDTRDRNLKIGSRVESFMTSSPYSDFGQNLDVYIQPNRILTKP